MANTDERAKLLKLSRDLDRMKNPCQICRARGAIGSKIHLAANFGLFVRRAETHFEGDFCEVCIHKKLAGLTFTNLFGWFGIVSMVKAPIFLISNFIQYGHALRVIRANQKQRTTAVDQFLKRSENSN